MLKIIFEVKIYKNIRISDTTPNTVSTSTWLFVTSNMENSFVGRHGILCPPRLKKWRGHVTRVPHQIAPMPEATKSGSI